MPLLSSAKMRVIFAEDVVTLDTQNHLKILPIKQETGMIYVIDGESFFTFTKNNSKMFKMTNIDEMLHCSFGTIEAMKHGKVL